MEASFSRLDPFRDLWSQSEVSRMLGNVYRTAESTFTGSWSPVVDILESAEKFQIIVELPGLSTSDVDITVEDNVLVLTGERRPYQGTGEETLRRIERSFGPFGRRITLPSKSDAARIEASMNDGLLVIDVPKVEQAKPHKIQVKSSG
jgi:HSP20 family protein